MNKLLVISLLLLSGVAAADDPTTRMRVLENGSELAASALRLPATASGNLDIHACATCASRSVPLTAETQFFVGSTQVSLAELRSYLDANPNKAVLVVTPVNQSSVSRIVASGQLRR